MSEPRVPAQIPEAAAESHIGILGKTGSGKTTTGKVFIEQRAPKGARICILDPIKSDWWGVISSADGKRPGLPFHVLGGPHGHVPLHSGAGAAIAELVASGKLPLSVLDMADFEPGGQHRFFVAFAETLLKKMRGALYLVLEEAHEFAPKERSGVGGHENLSIHWAKKLATAGRSKGIRLVLLTQRTQALHNAMLGSCETMIVHRLTAPADQKPVLNWLKANVQDERVRSEIADSMSSLKTGTGWLCSGEARIFQRVAFPRSSTFDNTATPTGDAGELAVRSADVDFDALRTLIGDAVVEAEANDPRKLKARIAELDTMLRKAPSNEGSLNVEQANYVNKLRLTIDGLAADKAAIEQHRDAVVAALDRARVVAADMINVCEEFVRGELSARLKHIPATPPFPTLTKPSAPPPTARTSPTRFALPSRPAAVAAPRSSKANGATPPSALTKGQIAILTAIVQHPEGVEAGQLTLLTGYARSTRDRLLQELRSLGHVTQGWPVRPTETAIAALGADYEPLPLGDDLRTWWMQRLDQGGRTMLETLAGAYPRGIDRDELSERTGYARSTRDRLLQELRARKLVESRGREVFASEALFG